MNSIANATTAAYMSNVGGSGAGGLTADALYLYLQNRLGGIDDQINSIMDKQAATELARKSLQGIDELVSGLKDNEDGMINVRLLQNELDDMPDMRSKKEVADALYIKLDEDGQIINEPGREDNISRPEGHSDLKLSLTAEQVGTVKKTFSNAVKDLGSQGELEMIKLQSLMGQRNSAISLATNLMSAVGKGYESIVGNIRS
jgi:hypothetical protein